MPAHTNVLERREVLNHIESRPPPHAANAVILLLPTARPPKPLTARLKIEPPHWQACIGSLEWAVTFLVGGGAALFGSDLLRFTVHQSPWRNNALLALDGLIGLAVLAMAVSLIFAAKYSFRAMFKIKSSSLRHKATAPAPGGLTQDQGRI